MSPDRAAECLYFGCHDRPGHFLWVRGWRHVPNYNFMNRWVYHHKIDGGLAPKGIDEREGVAALHHLDGWTVISFWDRSVDKRGACNSAFLVLGEMGFEDAVRVAREFWPDVWARFTFTVELLPSSDGSSPVAPKDRSTVAGPSSASPPR